MTSKPSHYRSNRKKMLGIIANIISSCSQLWLIYSKLTLLKLLFNALFTRRICVGRKYEVNSVRAN